MFDFDFSREGGWYRITLLTWKYPSVGPYSCRDPRAVGWSQEGWRFRISEVPPYLGLRGALEGSHREGEEREVERRPAPCFQAEGRSFEVEGRIVLSAGG